MSWASSWFLVPGSWFLVGCRNIFLPSIFLPHIFDLSDPLARFRPAATRLRLRATPWQAGVACGVAGLIPFPLSAFRFPLFSPDSHRFLMWRRL